MSFSDPPRLLQAFKPGQQETLLAPVEKNNQDYEAEYVHMSLPNGEAVRFKRVWSGHRFTDEEVELLIAGYDIRIKTLYTDGVTGSLDWQEYNGQEYFGFAPWDAVAHKREDAPFPIQWNDHVFKEEEQAILRRGKKLLVLCESHRNLAPYAVHVSFGFIPEDGPYPARWGIIPHFEEFNQPAHAFTRKTCVFLPMFSGKTLSLSEIERVRQGKSVPFEGVSRYGRSYQCGLTLELDHEHNRWRLTPDF